MILLRITESLLVGGTTGFLSGLLGIGGGFILVPLLTLTGASIHTAVGTSLAFISCVSFAGIIQHTRQGSIDFLLALALTLPAAVMAGIGARLSSHLSPALLYLLFSALTLGVLVFFHFTSLPRPVDAPRPDQGKPVPVYIRHRQRLVAQVCYSYDVHMIKAVLGGLATGLVSGFFGVGGGFLLVPLSVIVLRIPMQVTVGTCLAVTVPPALVGALTHWHLGHVDLGLWMPLVFAGIFTSQFGARCTVRVHPTLLKRLFLLLILGGTLYMLGKGLAAV
jgi:hypothetical protein